MPTSNAFTYTIVGYGRVGAALDAALRSINGLCVGIVPSSDPSKKAKIPDNTIRLSSIDDLTASDFVFIAVPDNKIEAVAQALPVDKLKLGETIVAHLSGSKPSESLGLLTNQGISTASAHPLMTFKVDASSSVFVGTPVSLEGTDTAVEKLWSLFQLIGARPVKVTPEQKKLLHLAAVITSNFMSSLVFYAADVMNSIDDNPDEFVRNTLGPLMLKTAENIITEGYPSALTGPASRGDTTTIQEHLELLEKLTIDSTLYRELTAQILHFNKHKQT